MFRLLQLLIAFTIVFHASAVDHCAPTYQPIEGDTCIDLSLCPTDAMTSMCSFLAFPVCGCDNMTYLSSCRARLNGVSSSTEGECGKPSRAPFNLRGPWDV